MLPYCSKCLVLQSFPRVRGQIYLFGWGPYQYCIPVLDCMGSYGNHCFFAHDHDQEHSISRLRFNFPVSWEPTLPSGVSCLYKRWWFVLLWEKIVFLKQFVFSLSVQTRPFYHNPTSTAPFRARCWRKNVWCWQVSEPHSYTCHQLTTMSSTFSDLILGHAEEYSYLKGLISIPKKNTNYWKNVIFTGEDVLFIAVQNFLIHLIVLFKYKLCMDGLVKMSRFYSFWSLIYIVFCFRWKVVFWMWNIV